MNRNIGIQIIKEFKDNIIKNFNAMGLSDMGYAIEFVFMIDPSFAEEIINVDLLVDYKLGSTSTSLLEVEMFLRDLDLIRKTERRLYHHRDINWLQVCIDFLDRNWTQIKSIFERDKDKESVETTLGFISRISHLDINRGKEAVNLAKGSYLISRLNEIEGLNELSSAIYCIEDIYPEFKNLILIEFVKVIENEIKIDGIYSVAYFFGGLIKDSNILENGKGTLIQILNLMDINIMKTMKESSVYPFCMFGELGI
jgi:hypothetical protein